MSSAPVGLLAGRASKLHPLQGCALFGGLASVVAITARVATPFDHGIWLIAYLVLVGFAAPLLLAAGEIRLLAEPREGAELEAGGWSAGTITVPAGVFVDARLLIVFGALALLLALASISRRAFAGVALPAPDRPRRFEVGHTAVIIFMAVSTVVGVLLAWGTPWL